MAAVGMYDGVHLGHRYLIDHLKGQATTKGLAPSVVTFDRHPLSVVRPGDAPKLLGTLGQREKLLCQAGVEDCIVLPFTGQTRQLTAREFLQLLHDRYGIDALLVGFNHRFGRDRAEGFEQYREVGTQIGMELLQAPEYVGPGAPVSSSIIRRELQRGEVGKARDGLGRHYSVAGTVSHGDSIGHTLGFPTANLEIPEDILIPANGVYATIVTTPDGVRRKAMLNIGHRPTVNAAKPGQLRVEAHIFDFDGNLYGRELTATFIERLRDERQFPSLDALRMQLREDAKNATSQLKNHPAVFDGAVSD